MTIPSTQLGYSNEITGNTQIDSIQSTVRKTQQYVNALGTTPFVTDPITFAPGQQIRIPHKLGRVPLEWSTRDITGSYGVFFRVSWDDVFITIQSGNACTAVFRIA